MRSTFFQLPYKERLRANSVGGVVWVAWTLFYHKFFCHYNNGNQILLAIHCFAFIYSKYLSMFNRVPTPSGCRHVLAPDGHVGDKWNFRNRSRRPQGASLSTRDCTFAKDILFGTYFENNVACMNMGICNIIKIVWTRDRDPMLPECVCTDSVDSLCPLCPVCSTRSIGLMFLWLNCVLQVLLIPEVARAHLGALAPLVPWFPSSPVMFPASHRFDCSHFRFNSCCGFLRFHGFDGFDGFVDSVASTGYIGFMQFRKFWFIFGSKGQWVPYVRLALLLSDFRIRRWQRFAPFFRRTANVTRFPCLL